MSATNRGAVRHPDDYYATPEWCTRAILPHLPPARSVLEPGCGDGAIARVLVNEGGHVVHGVEVDGERACHAEDYCHAVHCGDFLRFDPPWHKSWDLAVGNPPYKLAQEFTDQALKLCREVCFLLRLNFLGSQKRAPWLREHPADVFVLPKRPSFTGNGTDAIEYAWFIFGPQRERRWDLLEIPTLQAMRAGQQQLFGQEVRG